MAIQTSHPVTMESGTSISDIIAIGTYTMVAIAMPAGWTAADITIQGSVDGTNFDDLYSSTGDEVVIKAAANRFIAIDTPAYFIGARYIKIRSGTSAVPVNQAADRELTIITHSV